MDLPKVAVIVVTYNCSEYIMKLVYSLTSISYPVKRLQVVFIDNSSTDDTYSKLLHYSKELLQLGWNVKVFRLYKNIGFPAAVNLGIRYVLKYFNPEIIIIINPDLAIIDQEFILKIVKLMRTSNKICLVSPIILHQRERRDRIQWFCGLMDITGTAYMGLYGVPIYIVKMLCSRYKVLPSPWATFASVAINIKCLRELGLLRSEFFLYYEDVEYSLRALSKGYLVLSLMEPMVTHVEGGSNRPPDVQTLARIAFVKNSLITTIEYLGIISFAIRLILYLARVFRFSKDSKLITYGMIKGLTYVIRQSMRRKIRVQFSIPKYLLVKNNNIMLLTLKYRSLETAIRIFGLKGFVEYMKGIRKLLSL